MMVLDNETKSSINVLGWLRDEIDLKSCFSQDYKVRSKE